MREILISVDIASRRIIFPRCRARRLVSHSARAANAYWDIGSSFRDSAVGEVQLPCDMALDVVIDTSGMLSLEADILVFDPHKVVASGGSTPRFCYVRSYLGYDQEDSQDMNQVTRRGTNWHNLQINDVQDQWYGGIG
jgi:hypothetical protein